MDIEVLKSYLVSLGFAVNQPQFRQFDTALKDAAGLVSFRSAGMVRDLLKWQGVIVGAFAAITGGVVGLADHVAESDQQWRLMGLRMFMTKEQARKLDIGMKELGASMAEIAWDPELNQRFLELSHLQDQLAAKLGANFNEDMRAIRDLRFEFTKLKVTLEYLSFKLAAGLFEKLGLTSDSISAKIEKLTTWLSNHLPEASSKLANTLLPLLGDAWEIFKNLGHELLAVGDAFSNVIGALTGDTSIADSADEFQKISTAVLHTADFLADLANLISTCIERVAHLTSGLAYLFQGKWKQANDEGNAIFGPLPELSEVKRKRLQQQQAGSASLDLTDNGSTDQPFTATRSPLTDQPFTATRGPLTELVGQIAQLNGVNARLAQAVAQQESGTREVDAQGRVIRSKVGALGVMQLMPDTARGLHADPNDAADNIQGGVTLLAQLLKHYHQSIPQALAAYNWGQGNLDRAIQRHEAIPLETQNYVQSIMRNLGQPLTVEQVKIEILQPNATPHEVYHAAKRGMADAVGKQTQRMTAQLSFAGG